MKLADVTNPAVDPSIGTSAVQPDAMVSSLLARLLDLILVVGTITFVFMLLFGGYQWITSGGDKDALARAKNRLTHAVAGLVIMFALFASINFLSEFLGVNLTTFTF